MNIFVDDDAKTPHACSLLPPHLVSLALKKKKRKKKRGKLNSNFFSVYDQHGACERHIFIIFKDLLFGVVAVRDL